MKKIVMIASLALLLLPACLNAVPPNPRAWYFLLQDHKGDSLPDEVERFQSRSVLKGVTRTHKTTGFGFVYGNGNMYAKIELGNFGVEWLPGDTLYVVICRQGDPATGTRINLPIPEGYSAIWWGQPVTLGKEYPGEPVRLYPFHLSVSVDNKSGVKVFRDSLDTGFMTGQEIFHDNLNFLEGLYSLEAPTKGWRWEPAKYLVTLWDFEFSESAYTDANGVARPGWARTLEFRLVPSDPEG